MSTCFGLILLPMPPSTSSVFAPPCTSSGREASEIRLRSSAGARFSHSGFGTTPNIAPPSSLKRASSRGVSLRSPRSIERGGMVSESFLPLTAGLLQLHQHAVRTRRMDERDERVVRTGTRNFVDQAHAFGLQLRERRDDVVDAKRDVVEAGSAPGDELRNR